LDAAVGGRSGGNINVTTKPVSELSISKISFQVDTKEIAVTRKIISGKSAHSLDASFDVQLRGAGLSSGTHFKLGDSTQSNVTCKNKDGIANGDDVVWYSCNVVFFNPAEIVYDKSFIKPLSILDSNRVLVTEIPISFKRSSQNISVNKNLIKPAGQISTLSLMSTDILPTDLKIKGLACKNFVQTVINAYHIDYSCLLSSMGNLVYQILDVDNLVLRTESIPISGDSNSNCAGMDCITIYNKYGAITGMVENGKVVSFISAANFKKIGSTTAINRFKINKYADETFSFQVSGGSSFGNCLAIGDTMNSTGPLGKKGTLIVGGDCLAQKSNWFVQPLTAQRNSSGGFYIRNSFNGECLVSSKKFHPGETITSLFPKGTLPIGFSRQFTNDQTQLFTIPCKEENADILNSKWYFDGKPKIYGIKDEVQVSIKVRTNDLVAMKYYVYEMAGMDLSKYPNIHDPNRDISQDKVCSLVDSGTIDLANCNLFGDIVTDGHTTYVFKNSNSYLNYILDYFFAVPHYNLYRLTAISVTMPEHYVLLQKNMQTYSLSSEEKSDPFLSAMFYDSSILASLYQWNAYKSGALKYKPIENYTYDGKVLTGGMGSMGPVSQALINNTSGKITKLISVIKTNQHTVTSSLQNSSTLGNEISNSIKLGFETQASVEGNAGVVKVSAGFKASLENTFTYHHSQSNTQIDTRTVSDSFTEAKTEQVTVEVPPNSFYWQARSMPMVTVVGTHHFLSDLGVEWYGDVEMGITVPAVGNFQSYDIHCGAVFGTPLPSGCSSTAPDGFDMSMLR